MVVVAAHVSEGDTTGAPQVRIVEMFEADLWFGVAEDLQPEATAFRGSDACVLGTV
ncbi:MAG: hypothetical protein ACO3JL_13300 [Myxococcota bacterium]